MWSLDDSHNTPLLSLRGIGKSYAVPVLTDVDLDLHPGEVHALMGANGAGKSTLVRIVCGLAVADRGMMTLAGQPHVPASRRTAEDAGVQVVLQDLNLIDTLSVAENLFLARLPCRFGIIDRALLQARATQALGLVGLEALDPRTPVAALGIGRRQLVEVAAALARNCRVLVLDEPTAALTAPEVDRLFAHVQALRDRGIAVLYISHRMEEIARLADRVTVLRDGSVVGHGTVADMPRALILALMTGNASDPPDAGSAGSDRRPDLPDVASSAARDSRPALPDAATSAGPDRRPLPSRRWVASGCPSPMALRVEHLRCGRAVRDVSFEVRRGEILGLSGLVGAGRTETLRAIFGADRAEGGQISLGDGPALRLHRPRDAIRAGIGMVPEDRQSQALLLSQSIRSNITLATLGRMARGRTWIDVALERRTALDLAARLDVRGPGLEHHADALSGGNQQKVVLARWLLRDCAVLLVDEPTRGIDAAATLAIHDELRGLAARGIALVVVSSELDELTTLCDRIVVLAAGCVTGTFVRGAWSETSLMAAAFTGAGVAK